LLADLATAQRLVDLSVTLSEHLPCSWPGHVPYVHKNWNWFEEATLPTGGSCCSTGPYQTNFLVIDEHCGTHCDGPTHFIPPSSSGLPWAGAGGDRGGEWIDLAHLTGPAAVIDVRHLAAEAGEPGVSPEIGLAELERWESEHGPFRDGEVVLLWTGWDAHYVRGEAGRRFVSDPLVTSSAPGWPALAADAALYLHERRVRTVGIDAPSMGSVENPAPVHQKALSRGMYFIEMLTNLHLLPSRGSYFIFLPLKIADSTGGPGRAVAFPPQGNSQRPAPRRSG